MPGEVRASTDGRAAGDRDARSVQGRVWLQIGGRARGGAHLEHVLHVRDAGGIPVGDVRIEILQVIEELAHVGDGRDAPVGDGAVLRNGRGRVRIELRDRRLQGGLGREGVLGRAGNDGRRECYDAHAVWRVRGGRKDDQTVASRRGAAEHGGSGRGDADAAKRAGYRVKDTDTIGAMRCKDYQAIVGCCSALELAVAADRGRDVDAAEGAGHRVEDADTIAATRCEDYQTIVGRRDAAELAVNELFVALLASGNASEKSATWAGAARRTAR